MRILIIGGSLPDTEVISEVLYQFSPDSSIERIIADEHIVLDVVKRKLQYDLVFLNEPTQHEAIVGILKDSAIGQALVFISEDDMLPVKRLSRHLLFSCIAPPLDATAVRKIAEKYVSIKNHFQSKSSAVAEENREITRLVGRRRNEFFSIPVETVAYFCTENRVISFVTRDGGKYLAEFDSLSDLYDVLNKSVFYRINRKYIVNLVAIKKFRSYERLKIFIDLEIQTPENLVVSQDNASVFRKWVRQS